MKQKIADINTQHFGCKNYLKKKRHSNYFKTEMKAEECKIRSYYLPLIAWRIQNLMKLKLKEVENETRKKRKV